MQHVEGRTLESLLGDWARKEIAPPDANALRRVFVKLLRAVARAHRLDMPYGNLKPSNIVIDKHNEPFVLPVGRASSKARQMLGGLLQRLQHANSAGEACEDHDLEEVAYLVPEQLDGPDQMQDDKLADQYMLGLLAYQMATGQRPLRVKDFASLLRDGSGAMGPLPPVSAVRPLFPERLQKMLQRMTELDPGLRYPNLDQVLDEPDLHDDYSLVLARDSYRRCVRGEGLDSAFFGDFYRELQRLYPATRAHLARIEGPDRWRRQHHMLKQAVLLLLAFAQRSDDGEPNVLSHISASHAQIPPGLYVPFMKVLVAMVCGDASLGIAARDPVCVRTETARLLQKHWLIALKPGIDYLTESGLRRDEAGAAATDEPAAPL
jgi:serine/threonine protein kinase